MTPICPPAGLLFAEGNVDDLVAQITRLLDDLNLRNTLVAQGRIRAREFSTERFATNVLAVVEEAMKVAQQEHPPVHALPVPPLAPFADIVIRDYHVRSGAPRVGPLIEWVRNNATTHFKEAYLDPILERQVNHNRLVAGEVAALQNEVIALRAEMNELRRQVATWRERNTKESHIPSSAISEISIPEIKEQNP